jgi:hypothetical protein
MSNIRFLDNVAVSSYQSSQNVGSNFPRVVFSGEIKTVSSNTNSYAYEVFNLGFININSGVGVVIGGQTVFSDALLRVENLLVNEGTVNIAGILELGDLDN